MKIINIVLTGGPCGGKTTGLTYVKQKLEDKGFLVLVVPEAATLCIEGGISPISDVVGVEIAQRAMMNLTICMEQIWTESARSLSKDQVIILHDRGIIDGRAYTNEGLYQNLLSEAGLDLVSARDCRYDAIFHMQTAALGAEKFYTLDNNGARYESPEEAIEADSKIINAWMGHPHLRIIDNTTDFPGKLHKLFEEICDFLGIPVPVEKERKFLVSFDAKDLPCNAQHIDIEQVYLNSSDPNKTVRIRKRGQNGSFAFYKTIKMETGEKGERFEIEEPISASEYQFGLELKQKGTEPVRKTRICFLFENQYFELDCFEDDDVLPKGKSLLELEMTDLSKEIIFPDWLRVEREVTGDPDFSNHRISMRLSKQKG